MTPLEVPINWAICAVIFSMLSSQNIGELFDARLTLRVFRVKAYMGAILAFERFSSEPVHWATQR